MRRACFAADRTGHMILQTLYQQCIKAGVKFYDEYHVVDLVDRGRRAGRRRPGGRRRGLPDRRRRARTSFRAKAVLLATGGFGRMFRITSNAWSPHRRRRARWRTATACPLEDMEFYQFHPTGIVGIGILLSEAARGEGGILLNGDGERFMERYAPTLMELAPRDMVSRAMYQEIRDGPRDRRQGLRLPGRPPPRPQGHRGEAARHHGLRPRLPGRRADHRAGPDPADRPLRDGRHPHRHRHAGDPRRANTVGPGPVRRRRVRLRQRPRRQPAGHQLARRPPRLRAARRPPDGRRRQRRGHCRTSPSDVDRARPCRDRGDRGRASGERTARRSAPSWPT